MFQKFIPQFTLPFLPMFRSNFSLKNIFSTTVFELFCGIFRCLATVSGPIRMKFGNEGEGGMDKL
jgi:hypothetical protein